MSVFPPFPSFKVSSFGVDSGGLKKRDSVAADVDLFFHSFAFFFLMGGGWNTNKNERRQRSNKGVKGAVGAGGSALFPKHFIYIGNTFYYFCS